MSKAIPLHTTSTASQLKHLTGETEDLLRRQRQKKKEDYGIRDGSGRPELFYALVTPEDERESRNNNTSTLPMLGTLSGLGDMNMESLGLTAQGGKKSTGNDRSGRLNRTVPAGGTGKGARSTSNSGLSRTSRNLSRTATRRSDDDDSPVAATTENVGLEDYDPKAIAAREVAELTETVAKMRAEASKMSHQVRTLEKQYEQTQLECSQLIYEDTVDSDRKNGLRRMNELKDQIVSLLTQLEECEFYQKTLQHMIKRSEEEKLEELSTLKAYESAITVHKDEFDMAENVLRQVKKSKNNELAALTKMQNEIKAHLASLDEKLEMRRMETEYRKERAIWRERKILAEIEARAKANGDLTVEGEEQLRKAATEATNDASTAQVEKNKAIAEADAVEAQYIRLRIAAGVQENTSCPFQVSGDGAGQAPGATLSGTAKGLPNTTGGAPSSPNSSSPHNRTLKKSDSSPSGAAEDPLRATAGGSGKEKSVPMGPHGAGCRCDDLTFAQPDPNAIISRFSSLEDELRHVEEQLEEQQQRLVILRQQQSLLEQKAQPRAKDAIDEDEEGEAICKSLEGQVEERKRRLEVANRKFHESRALKLELEQSLLVLFERLDNVPTPEFEATEEKTNDELARMELAELTPLLPSNWSQNLHTRILDAVNKLQLLMIEMDLEATENAGNAAAKHWKDMMEHNAIVKNLRSPQSERLSIALDPYDQAIQEVETSPHLISPSPSSIKGTSATTGSENKDKPDEYADDEFEKDVESPSTGKKSASKEKKDKSKDKDKDDLFRPPSDGEEEEEDEEEIDPEQKEMLRAAALEADRHLDAAIESLVVQNEWTIRVRPGSKGTRRPKTFIHGNLLSEAVSAFEKTWKERDTLAVTEPAKSGLVSYRSYSEVGGDAVPGDEDDEFNRNSDTAMNTTGPWGSSSSLGSTYKSRVTRFGSAAPDANTTSANIARPRARDIQKLLMLTSTVLGDEVDENLVSSINNPTANNNYTPALPCLQTTNGPGGKKANVASRAQLKKAAEALAQTATAQLSSKTKE